MSNCIICGCTCKLKPKSTEKYNKYCSNKCIKTAYRVNHPEANKRSQLKYIQQNPEKRKLASDRYRKSHKEYYALYVRLRKNNKKSACPSWADLEEIKCIYQEAEYFQLEVDHIIPLKHKLVCGLHVPDNLQLLSRSENARKSNKFDEDILGVITDE